MCDMNEDEYMTRKNALELEILNQKRIHYEIGQKIKSLEAEQAELQSQYNLLQLRKKKDSGINEYAETRFEWSDDIRKLLKEKFKFDNFRSKQLIAINGTLSKRDVMLVMPTGGGKSLVYQLPAVFCNHITLVISPLISLIEDQIRGLREVGIKAASLNSTTEKGDKKMIYDALTDPNLNLKLLYVTPEWAVKSKIFLNHLQKCYQAGFLDRIVIDEVHCCSTWGHDFRPDYSMLGIIRTMCKGVPILGLTATATINTLVDIQEILELKNCLIITAPFNRPNLYYKVIHKPAEKQDCLKYLVDLIKNRFSDKSGIIYTTTTTECDEITKGLRGSGIEARAYYAQLDDKLKKKVQQYWYNNKIQVIVATVAFGMGIDKPDVRFVIHNCVPKSLESYYQESGRAGRDSQRAECILMFNLNDYLRNVAMCASTRELGMTKPILQYCLNVDSCRRRLIADHFEDSWRKTDCAEMCDNCKKPKNVCAYDISPALNDILQIVNHDPNHLKLTFKKLLLAWYQKGDKKSRILTLKPPQCSERNAEYIIGHLIYRGYLKVHKVYNLYSAVPYIIQGDKTSDKPVVVTHLSVLKFPRVEGQSNEIPKPESSQPPIKKLKT